MNAACAKIQKSFPADIFNVWFKEEQNVSTQMAFAGLLSTINGPGTITINFSRRIPITSIRHVMASDKAFDNLRETIYLGIPEIMRRHIRQHKIEYEPCGDIIAVFEAKVSTPFIDEFADEFVKQGWGIFSEQFDLLMEEELSK
jgi:hypothetical protein